jgi:hypothetical protein
LIGFVRLIWCRWWGMKRRMTFDVSFPFCHLSFHSLSLSLCPGWCVFPSLWGFVPVTPLIL